jgi:hypothetical protein
VTSFDDRYNHEVDTVNFLSSGKEWYGEEFGVGSGRLQTRDFSLNPPGLTAGSPFTIFSEVIGRSAGQASSFDIKLNRTTVQTHNLPALPGVAYEPVATQSSLTTSTTLSQPAILLSFTFFPGSVNGQGWLNRFTLNFRRNLDMQSVAQLVFRDKSSVGPGQNAEFVISNTMATTRVWDITDPRQPVEQEITRDGTNARFRNNSSMVREYIAFEGARYGTPVLLGKISNQNLHGSQQVGYIIITHPKLRAEAERIGQYHRQKENLSFRVTEVGQIYNEFSSGSPDPTALRDYVKMFYDRAGSDSTARPRYLLLFGDGSFDYRDRIDGNTNLVPAYESPFSLDPLTSYTSDDFYGMLDDGEDINSVTSVANLDIGIGRVPAANASEAKAYVDKLAGYSGSFGPWRNQLSLLLMTKTRIFICRMQKSLQVQLTKLREYLMKPKFTWMHSSRKQVQEAVVIQP